MKQVCRNPKAYHDYFIEDKFECGIVLQGTEVKSLRQGKASIKESICKILNNEVYILGMHISPYENGNIWNHDETRTRKLLLHRKEITKINDKLVLKGYTLIPLEVYFNDKGLAKMVIATCRGKKMWDKKEDKKIKDINKDIAKALKKEIK